MSFLVRLFWIPLSRLSLAPLRGVQNLGRGGGLPAVFLCEQQAVQVLPTMWIRKVHVVVPAAATTPQD